jgi:hypothetical protein
MTRDCNLQQWLNHSEHGMACCICPACFTAVCSSGGERSFTTMAFLLALGERTESPFRAMDEYDVFMDARTRRIATQTLLQFALEQQHLQLVLLTPQVWTCADQCAWPSR